MSPVDPGKVRDGPSFTRVPKSYGSICLMRPMINLLKVAMTALCPTPETTPATSVVRWIRSQANRPSTPNIGLANHSDIKRRDTETETEPHLILPAAVFRSRHPSDSTDSDWRDRQVTVSF